MSKKNQAVRRDNYKRLKRAGFNSYEATQYKDLTSSKMEDIIKHRKAMQGEITNVLQRAKT